MESSIKVPSSFDGDKEPSSLESSATHQSQAASGSEDTSSSQALQTKDSIELSKIG